MHSRVGMSGRRRTSLRARIATATAALMMIAAVTPTMVGAAHARALPRGVSDISSTSQGERLIKEAKERFAAHGAKGELKAIKDHAGILIAPAGSPLVATRLTLDNGKTGTVMVPATASGSESNDAAAAQTGTVAALAAPSWNFQISQCFARINDTWSYMDHCYQLYKMANDGDGTKDYFALRHFATLGANPPWVMNWGLIRAYRLNGTPAQTWVDWSPKADYNDSCRTFNGSITVKGVGLGFSFDECGLVDMTKQNPAVDYQLMYFHPGERADRELTFEIAVSVAQGAWPQWVIPAEVHGGPI
jgi:hypothetical protein